MWTYSSTSFASQAFTLGSGIEGILEKTHWPDNRATLFPLVKSQSKTISVPISRMIIDFISSDTKIVVVHLEDASAFAEIATQLPDYKFFIIDTDLEFKTNNIMKILDKEVIAVLRNLPV